MSVKAIYAELKGLINELPTNSLVSGTVVDGFHGTIDLLSQETGKDYSRFKVSHDSRNVHAPNSFNGMPVRVQAGRLIGYLEGEYELAETNNSGEPGLNVSVINSQTIAMTINQTIQQLIEKTDNEEEKIKLRELETELSKPDKDWTKIKVILKWVLDFSEKLFFQLLPTILKHYGLNP